MSDTPEAAKLLVLDLVRPQVETGRCPLCGGGLTGCGLALGTVDLDRIVVAVTCASCAATATLTVRPAEEGGRATIT